MSNYTFKVHPDPQGSSKNKVLNDELNNVAPKDELSDKKSGKKCPPICPPPHPPNEAPFGAPITSPPPPPIFEQPPFEGLPYDLLPPFGELPPYGLLPPFEELQPFESIGHLLPNPPYQTPFSLPVPDPIIPVLPGYTIKPRLGHAYVPWQFFAETYNPDEALSKGTMFPELNQPQGAYGPCEGPKPCRLKPVHPQGGVTSVDE